MDNKPNAVRKLNKAMTWEHWNYLESLTPSEALEFSNALFTFATTCEAYTRRGQGKSCTHALDRTVSNLSAVVQYFVTAAKMPERLYKTTIKQSKVDLAIHYLEFVETLGQTGYKAEIIVIDNGNHHILSSSLGDSKNTLVLSMVQLTINRPETDVSYNPFEGEHQ